jgi:hypothetical protein
MADESANGGNRKGLGIALAAAAGVFGLLVLYYMWNPSREPVDDITLAFLRAYIIKSGLICPRADSGYRLPSEAEKQDAGKQDARTQYVVMCGGTRFRITLDKDDTSRVEVMR